MVSEADVIRLGPFTFFQVGYGPGQLGASAENVAGGNFSAATLVNNQRKAAGAFAFAGDAGKLNPERWT